MVEIRRSDSDTPQSPVMSPAGDGLEEQRFRLVYTKSKVYINPTAYARDNIPGFVALVKRVSDIFTMTGDLTFRLRVCVGGDQPDLFPELDPRDPVE